MKAREWLINQLIGVMEPFNQRVMALQTWLNDEFSNKIAQGLWDFAERLEPPAVEVIKPFMPAIMENRAVPPYIKKFFNDLMTPKHAVQLAALVPFIMIIAGAVIVACLWGLLTLIQQEAARQFNTYLTPVDIAIRAKWRGVTQGIDLDSELDKQGMTPEQVKMYEALMRYTAPPTDLIRFAVRDAFREDIVKQYGYDTDFDKITKELQPHLNAIGMDADMMKLYWRSHWENPSLTMAYELLHRRFITQDDIRLLLKINDVAPYWHESIIKASYAPYTRVDVRRMYGMGVLTQDEVYNSYRDIGYDDQHARKLTDWTVLEVRGTESKLSRAQAESAYRRGKLTKEQAIQHLRDLNYSKEDAELCINLVDYDEQEKLTEAKIAVYRAEVLKGQATVAEFKQKCGSLGLSARSVDLLSEKLSLDIQNNVKLPSQAALDAWLKGSIISEAEYQDYMRKQGYSTAVIALFLKAAKAGK